MSKRVQGVLMVIFVIIALAVIAYYAAGGTLTVRNVLEGGLLKEEGSDKKSATSTATSTDGEAPGEVITEETENYEINSAYPISGVGYKLVRDYVLGDVESFKTNVADASAGATLRRKHTHNSSAEKFVTDKYVSYKILSSTYSGGANGIEQVKTFVFTKDGEQVMLDELVPEDKRDELVREVKEGIREVNNVSEGEELQTDITYEDFEDYFVTDKSLVLTFDEYVVAPGAEGVVSIPVDINTISN